MWTAALGRETGWRGGEVFYTWDCCGAAAEAAGCVRTPHASYDEPPPAPRSRSGTVRMAAVPEQLPIRRDVLCGLLALPLAARSASESSEWSSDDGAFSFRLPATWTTRATHSALLPTPCTRATHSALLPTPCTRPTHCALLPTPCTLPRCTADPWIAPCVCRRWEVEADCSPSRNRAQCEAYGRRAVVTARRAGGGAAASATVDLGGFGNRLAEYATLDEAADSMASALPRSARLLHASARTSRAGVPTYYELRYRDGARALDIKLGVRQSRLYTLAVERSDADDASAIGAELRAEAQSIFDSFAAYPVSSMRGGLLRSDDPPVLRPPPLVRSPPPAASL